MSAEDLYRACADDGLTAAQTAARLGVKKSAVKSAAARYGIKFAMPKYISRTENPTLHNGILYRSQKALARYLGVSDTTVSHYLARGKIESLKKMLTIDPSTPPDAWYACHVQRWHSGASAPWLARSGDAVGGHQGRMGALALTVWPKCSRALLVACIVHDLGEYGACDVPCDAKSDPALRQAVERMEDATMSRMGLAYDLDAIDTRRLKFLDRLDAYFWAQHHAPQLVARPEWVAAREWLMQEAKDMTHA